MYISRIILLVKDYENYFNEIDLIRCLTDDWQFDRFNLSKENFEENFKKYLNMIKWKQKVKIHSQLNLKDYEQLISLFNIFGIDYDDRLVIGAVPEISPQLSSEEFIINLYKIIEHLDSFCHKRGFIFFNKLSFSEMRIPNPSTRKYARLIINNFPGLIHALKFYGDKKFYAYFFNVIRKIILRKNSLIFSFENDIQIKKKFIPKSYAFNKINNVY